MKHWVSPTVVGAAVALAIVGAGGAGHTGVMLLAATGAVTFGDLTRRALAERFARRRDPTDFWMSAAFALILVGGAWDHGRDSMAEWPWELEWVARLVGFASIAAGVVLRRRAARALGANFLVRLGVREGHTLVQSGPYRSIRHPTYAALLAVAVGTSIALGSVAALVVTVALWLPIVFARMSREERVLLREFGEEYREYMARTWRLVPGVV
ncbi:MAG: methyltransferase [Candidatus Binatia bacterium]